MLNLKLINSKEEFLNLKKGDILIVKWSENWLDHMSKAKEIMFYNIYENKSSCNEIICQKKDNHYFNYNLYLEGRSAALEVYTIIDLK